MDVTWDRWLLVINVILAWPLFAMSSRLRRHFTEDHLILLVLTGITAGLSLRGPALTAGDIFCAILLAAAGCGFASWYSRIRADELTLDRIVRNARQDGRKETAALKELMTKSRRT